MPAVKVKDSLTLSNKSKRRSIITASSVKPLKLPPISTISKDQKEKWDIQALPSDWKVDTTPSKVVEKLLQKRQREHEEAIESMRNLMAEINSNIEDQIRVASSIYKQRLNVSKKDLEECMSNVRQIIDGPADLSLGNFAKAIEGVSEIYKINKYQLFMLYQKLKDFERQRSIYFRNILKRTYTRLHEISYKLPQEIQEFFEQEIQVINEITLNNVRAYKELKFMLKSLLGNEIRLWLEEIQYIKENWLYYVKLMVFTNLNQNELFDKDCNEQVLQGKDLSEFGSTISSYSFWQNESTIDTNKMFDWVNRIENTMHYIDSSAKALVLNFKTAVMKVVYGYLDEMKNTARRIYDLGLIGKSEISIVKSEFCGRAVMDVTNKYTKELSDVQSMWANVKKELQCTLEEAFVFLNHFSEIWHLHLRRVTVIKSTVSKDLKRQMGDGYLLVSGEEAKINMLIDSLRQEYDPRRMTELVTDISKALDILRLVYRQNCQDECCVVERIMDLLIMEGELLESELAYFLTCYYETYEANEPVNDAPSMVPKVHVPVDPSEDFSEGSISSDEMNAARCLLSAEVRKCKAQLQLLRRWKMGLYFTLSRYKNDCKEENANLGKQWICEEHFKSKTKLEMIMQILHESRYKRIEPVMCDLTLAEVEEQTNRLKEHKAGLDQEVSNACLIYPKYEQKYDKVLEKCRTDVENIKNRVLNAQNSASVTSAMTTFDCTMAIFMNKIVKINELYETEFTSGISLIFNCNLRYLKAIKLFSEGGNFNYQRAREICNDLGKIEKLYKKKIAMVARQNEQKCSKCLEYLNTLKYESCELFSKYEEELKYYDNYIYKIKDVQTEIRNEVYSVKFKHKQMQSQVKSLWEVGEKSVGQPSSVKSFVEYAKRVFTVIGEYGDMLERPVLGAPITTSLSKSSHSRVLVTETSTLESTIKRLQTKIKSSATLHSLNFKDYSSFLFDVAPEKSNNNSFIGKMRYLLYNSYKSLQKEGKRFYEKHVNVEFANSDKIHPTYADFVADILPKYVYYYLQCEMVWLDQANAFVKLVDEIMSSLKIHQKKSLRTYIENSHENLRQAFNSVLAELADINSLHKSQFSALYKKLKALHGYPGNKELLEALNAELQHFFETVNDGHSDRVDSYKDNLNEKQTNYVVGLMEIHDQLDALKDLYEDQMFARDISVDFMDTILYLRKFVCLQSPAKSFDSVLAKANTKLDYYKKAIIIPPEYLLNVSANSLLYNSPINSSSNVLSEVIIQDEVEAYGIQVDEILNKIDSVAGENTGIVDYWKTMWDRAVESVLALYKVKYD